MLEQGQRAEGRGEKKSQLKFLVYWLMLLPRLVLNDHVERDVRIKKKKKGRPMPYSIGEVSKKLREKLRRPKRLK